MVVRISKNIKPENKIMVNDPLVNTCEYSHETTSIYDVIGVECEEDHYVNIRCKNGEEFKFDLDKDVRSIFISNINY